MTKNNSRERMTNLKPVKITNRNIMFTEPMEQDYDLNLGLIMGTKYNYIIDTGLGSGSVAPILEYIRECTRPIIVIIIVLLAAKRCCDRYQSRNDRTYHSMQEGDKGVTGR